MRLKNGNMNGIAAELKSKILAESMVEGAVISSVAKKYNISKGTIYHWMKQNSPTTNENKKFIELSVEGSDPYIEPKISDFSTLKSASLAWHDLSIEIEGKIMSSHLLEIIKILGNKSC